MKASSPSPQITSPIPSNSPAHSSSPPTAIRLPCTIPCTSPPATANSSSRSPSPSKPMSSASLPAKAVPPIPSNHSKPSLSPSAPSLSIKRHGHADYDLCDSTHCQLLHWSGSTRLNASPRLNTRHRRRNPLVPWPSAAAWFHQNCGGRTASPSEAWAAETKGQGTH